MEDIPKDYQDIEYPQRVHQRAVLANFDLNLFQEDDEDSLECKCLLYLTNNCYRAGGGALLIG